jgi:predicted ABC-class ATPase
MGIPEKLKQQLAAVDGQDYGACQSLLGGYSFDDYELFIDRIPKDPYAPPTTGIYRVRVDWSDSGFRDDMVVPAVRRVALRDYLARVFHQNCLRYSKGRRGTGNSGLITIAEPGQCILDRSSVVITGEYIEARFFIGMPANGRNINAALAVTMLFDELPQIVRQSLYSHHLDQADTYRHIETAEDAGHLRNSLREHGMIAFIADGAVLPRKSGVDERPLDVVDVVPFRAPKTLRVEMDLPNRGRIRGMGIPAGVTLIVGGGYHGKSTLLKTLEQGVYNHIPGDGREYCVTVPEAIKVRASSGRYVIKDDISPFLRNIPLQRDTSCFSTDNASGSTSQAASIVEAIEAGARLLFMDEDTCAANFMIRDKRMQELVNKDDEPITAFIDNVKVLYESLGISTVLVMGGCGDYFNMADHVIQMKGFVPLDVTHRAHEVAEDYPTGRVHEGEAEFRLDHQRLPRGDSIDPYNEYNRLRISAPEVATLVFGKQKVDLGDVEQIVESAQTKAIGLAMLYAQQYMDGSRPISDVIALIIETIEQQGIDVLDENLTGDIAGFRGLELAAALNRTRGFMVEQVKAAPAD